MIGMIGGAAGLLAMQAYWQKVAPQIKENVNLGGTEAYPPAADLDDISVAGQQHQEDESSTAALGRMIYHAVTGKEPESEETKEQLSNLVHWGYGLLQGGLYGAMRAGNGHSRGLDLLGGAVHATGLWLLGDETAVPLLGLQKGPTAVRPVTHINRYGAHLAYGLTTAATTQLLEKIL
jgi:hypothetical protein